MPEGRPPFPPFAHESAAHKVRGAEEGRLACINDLPIKESDRKYHWDRSGPRPADHPDLSDLGL
jgi:uncharacterized protein